MKKRLIPALILAALTASASPFPSQGLLNPSSGDLFGLPGQTVVWGVDLKNDTNDWWIFTSVQSDYTSTGAPGEIPDGPGFFTDYLSVNFLFDFVGNAKALAPNKTYFEGGGADQFDLPQVGTPGVDASRVSVIRHFTNGVAGQHQRADPCHLRYLRR